jgi:hypothetical protein
MKNLFTIIVFFISFLVLTAWGQIANTTLSPTSPAIRLNPSATLTLDTTTPAAIGTIPTLIPSPTLEPTLLPTIEVTFIPGLLNSSFVVRILDGMNGHNLHKITGWEYGFRQSGYCFGPYQWMNENHILLFPLTGQEYGMGTMQLSLPVVINHKSEKVWIPSIDGLLSLSSCDQPSWSHALNLLVTTQRGEIFIYNAEGDILNHFPGYNISLSPSGTKLMVDSTWIDLVSGKQVDFSSQGVEGLSTWSSDETQLYRCCYAYGNVLTGKAYTFELGGLRYVGRDYGEGFTGIRNMWVMDDTYIVTYWDFQNDTEYDILPLIEPSTQTYKKLQDLTDIPADTSCRLRGVAPNRKLIWANCYQPNNYLVNLETFTADPYPGNLSLVSWSSDSEFAWLRDFQTSSAPQVLSISNRKIQSLPVPAQLETASWHPTGSILAYLAEEKQTLVFLNVQTMSVQELALSIAFQTFRWSPNGDHIALIAEDGSIWQVDYPTLKNLEQLTTSLPDVRDVNWSPDGISIALISGSDIYIVETNH